MPWDVRCCLQTDRSSSTSSLGEPTRSSGSHHSPPARPDGHEAIPSADAHAHPMVGASLQAPRISSGLYGVGAMPWLWESRTARPGHPRTGAPALSWTALQRAGTCPSTEGPEMAMTDGADEAPVGRRWCVVLGGDDARVAVGTIEDEGVVLVVAASTANGGPLIEDLIADANAGRGPRELAERVERARRKLRPRVVGLLDDPQALDRLEDTQVLEVANIEQDRGSAAAATAVNAADPGGDERHDGRPATPLADAVAMLEREGMTATMVSRWLDTPHEDLDDRHDDPPATPAAAIDAGRSEEVTGLVARMIEAGTVPGPWTTCMACMRPARWTRTGGQGDVEIACEMHRQELGERDADPWQPTEGYDGRSGDQP